MTKPTPLFSVGDRVEKHTGDYHAEGEVRDVYETYDGGPVRYMVALDRITHGRIMHTLAGGQLRKIDSQAEDKEKSAADVIAELHRRLEERTPLQTLLTEDEYHEVINKYSYKVNWKDIAAARLKLYDGAVATIREGWSSRDRTIEALTRAVDSLEARNLAAERQLAESRRERAVERERADRLDRDLRDALGALRRYFRAWDERARGHGPTSSIWHTTDAPVSFEQHKWARLILAAGCSALADDSADAVKPTPFLNEAQNA